MGESTSEAMSQEIERLTRATVAMNLLGCLQGFARLMVNGLEMHQLVNVKVKKIYNTLTLCNMVLLLCYSCVSHSFKSTKWKSESAR
jgi:ABC-type polysaccharide transport system permease subunit